MSECFKECGKIAGVRLAVWGHTKQLKGFGYVDFKKEESAVIAVKKNGKLTLKKRPLIIDFETSEQKSNFKRNERLYKTNVTTDQTTD